MHAVLLLLAFVSSAFAYSVITPNGAQGWSNQGAQPLTWQRVESDRLNFTALLTNQRVAGFEPQILAALVDGNLGRVNLNPPSGGWTTGSGFRVNLVQDDNNLNTILAQSPEFTIAPSSSTSTSSARTSTTSNVFIPTTPTVTDTVPTDTLTIPTKSNAASTRYPVHSGLVALFSLLGFALA